MEAELIEALEHLLVDRHVVDAHDRVQVVLNLLEPGVFADLLDGLALQRVSVEDAPDDVLRFLTDLVRDCLVPA